MECVKQRDGVGELWDIENNEFSCILDQLQSLDSAERQRSLGHVVVQFQNDKRFNKHLSGLCG